MQFLVDHSIYVTLIIATMILVGLLVFVSRVDARVRRLERETELEKSAAR
ncbi:MAG TPA: hypothetical protein VNA88_17110 [Candidatus Kapabacteria bacterium]|jgi:hypothetical protein|nr:hypothetical protein [Candidatus Kapabacteria bacterium]